MWVKYAYMPVCYYLFSVTYGRNNFRLPLNIGGTLKTKGLSTVWLKPLNSRIGLGEYYSFCVPFVREVHSLFQSEFSIQCDLPVSDSLFSFHQLYESFRHPVAAYVSFSLYPSSLFPSITHYKDNSYARCFEPI